MAGDWGRRYTYNQNHKQLRRQKLGALIARVLEPENTPQLKLKHPLITLARFANITNAMVDLEGRDFLLKP